ncbi:four helix bundle protein [Planctomycetota bacterium]
MAESERKYRKYDLEERLINFAVCIINIVEVLPRTLTGNHIAGQLVRCGTAAAANYGEAQSAESRKDFIHKIKISLKELRETKIWLKVIQRKKLITKTKEVEYLLSECNELISIFVASIKTTEKNKGK